MAFDSYLNNSNCNNINIYMQFQEMFVESLRLYRKFMHSYYEFYNEMVECSIKSIENGNGGQELVTHCYNAYVSGYEAAKKDFDNSMKEMKAVREPANLYS